VDFVLPPKGIAKEIERIRRHPYLHTNDEMKPERVKDLEDSAASQGDPEKDLAPVLDQLRKSSGVDFSQYKPNTIHRRTLRRMVILKLDSLSKYAQYLKGHPEEANKLFDDSTRERLALQRYLDSIEKADEEQQASIDPSAVQAALQKLKDHPEPEIGFMLVRQTALPAYNVQTAVDAEHALIVAHAVVLDASDIRCLKPMAEAAKKALEVDSFKVVADAGYSNGEQVAHCEAAGMMPYVPVMRTVNNQGDGTLFGREDFRYEPDSDTYVCPGDKRLLRKHTNHKDRYTMYKASAGDCGTCSLKSRCTQAPRRGLARHLYEDALNRMQQRVTPEAMRLRRCTVEHPFATIKYRIFGHPRLLMRGLSGAKVEIGLATMAYNLKRIANLLGATKLTEALHHA
jgi:Transposase DDE domain/CheR methyltransferase, all-alpha domain